MVTIFPIGTSKEKSDGQPTPRLQLDKNMIASTVTAKYLIPFLITKLFLIKILFNNICTTFKRR